MFDLLSAERDGREDADGASRALFQGLVVQRLAVLVGTHDFDQVMFGNGVARLAAEDVIETRQGTALIVQTHEISLWVFDAPPRECIDMDICLVSGGDGNRSPVPFQKTFVETVHVLHEWYFEMQTRLGDRVANRLSKLRDDHLFGLVNRIESTGENEDQEKCNSDNRYSGKVVLFHYGRPSPGLIASGRVGSSCRSDSSTMIFCPVCGRISLIVSR